MTLQRHIPTSSQSAFEPTLLCPEEKARRQREGGKSFKSEVLEASVVRPWKFRVQCRDECFGRHPGGRAVRLGDGCGRYSTMFAEKFDVNFTNDVTDVTISPSFDVCLRCPDVPRACSHMWWSTSRHHLPGNDGTIKRCAEVS